MDETTHVQMSGLRTLTMALLHWLRRVNPFSNYCWLRWQSHSRQRYAM